MANWSKRKVDPSEINKGQEYTKDDNVSVEELNAIVNNSFNAQGEAERSLNTVKGFQIGTVVSGDVPSAVINVDSTGEKIILNLVLPKGDKGDKGEQGESGSQGTMDYNELMNKPAKFLGYFNYNTSSGQTLDDIEELKNIEANPVNPEYGFAYITNAGSYTTSTDLCVISTEFHVLSKIQVVFNLSTGEIYERSKSNFGDWTKFEKTTFLTTTGNAYGAYRDGEGNEITKTYTQKKEFDESINNLEESKVEKVEGKGLSTNDFTNEEKQKLAELENYVDTALRESISSIEEKIPSEASSTNKLVDRNLMNSSISTNTATFRGTFDNVSKLPTSGVDINDYAFVREVDNLGNVVYKRYKYTTKWEFEYDLNNSSFTAEQWNAINSKITADLVTQITTNKTNINTNTTNITKITNNTTKIADASGGFMGGTGAYSTFGAGAVGKGATATGDAELGAYGGGAIGAGSVSRHGAGAVGYYAKSSQGGFAGGYKAVAITDTYDAQGNMMGCIQLGEGTNETPLSLQVYGDNIYNAQTHELVVQKAVVGGHNVATSNNLDNYLPLTAGSGKPLTGDLYVKDGTTTKNIFLGNKARLRDNGSGGFIISTSGSMYLRCDGDGGHTTGLVLDGAGFKPQTNDGNSLGTSTNRWKEIHGTTIYQNGSKVLDAKGGNINAGTGIHFSAKDATDFMIYGDSSSQRLWTQIKNSDGTYQWYPLMDVSGKLYSGKKEVANKEDIEPVLLWENASPSSEVTNGTTANLTGDISNYALLRFDIRRHPSTEGEGCFFVKPTIGKSFSFSANYCDGTQYIYARGATITSSTQITFKTGYSNGSTSNSRMIPIAIYGYKY